MIDNDFAYHALAIDEHRKTFAPTLWTRKIPQDSTSENPRPIKDVEQRWFVGAHANVGGGYSSDLLAQIPLRWLMDKAKLHGLEFKRDVTIDGDENSAKIGDSWAEFARGIYRWISPKHFRPIGCNPTTGVENINETIDISVFERWRKDSSYRPQNLVDWAKLRGVGLFNELCKLS